MICGGGWRLVDHTYNHGIDLLIGRAYVDVVGSASYCTVELRLHPTSPSPWKFDQPKSVDLA